MTDLPIAKLAERERTALADLSTSAAHAFNNSLTTLLLNLDTAARSLPTSDSLGSSIGGATAAAWQMRRVVQHMSMFQAGSQPRVIDPRACADAVLALTHVSRPHSIKLEALFRPVPWVRCNPAVLTNILFRIVLDAAAAVTDNTSIAILALRSDSGNAQLVVTHEHPFSLSLVSLAVCRSWAQECGAALTCKSGRITVDLEPSPLASPRVLFVGQRRDQWGLELSRCIDTMTATTAHKALDQILAPTPFSAVVVRGLESAAVTELIGNVRSQRPGVESTIAIVGERGSMPKVGGIAYLGESPPPETVLSFANRCRADV